MSRVARENPIVDGTPSGLQAARDAYDGTKSVKFSNQLKLVLIPCREEHHKAGLVPALWWSSTDYLNFQASAHSEIRLLASFEGITYAAARKKLYQNNSPSEEVSVPSSSSSSSSLALDIKMMSPISPRGADAHMNANKNSSSSSRSPSTSPTTTSSSSFTHESSDESSDRTDKCSDEEEEEEEDASLDSQEDDSCREDPLSLKQNAQHKLHHHQQQQQHAALAGRANRSHGLVNGLTKVCMHIH